MKDHASDRRVVRLDHSTLMPQPKSLERSADFPRRTKPAFDLSDLQLTHADLQESPPRAPRVPTPLSPP